MRHRALALTMVMGAVWISAASVQAKEPLAGGRNFAEVKFSVEAREQNHVRHKDGNYVKWTKITRFDGTVQLTSAFESASADGIAPPPADTVPPFNETVFMMQGMAACQNETDPTRMTQCLSDAVTAASDKAKACANPPAGGKRPPECGAVGQAEDGGQHDVSGSPQGEGGSPSNDEMNPRIWRAVTCMGRTQVSGDGEGYDRSLLAKAHYSFDIRGDWQSVSANVGGSSGCSAGAIVDTKTGAVHLILKPAPGRIRTQRSYSNFRGVEEQPETAFVDLDAIGEIAIDITAEPGARTFGGTWRPKRESGSLSDPGHAVETVVEYSFSAE